MKIHKLDDRTYSFGIGAEEFDMSFSTPALADTWFGLVKAAQCQQETVELQCSLDCVQDPSNPHHLPKFCNSDGPFSCLYYNWTLTTQHNTAKRKRKLTNKFWGHFQGSHCGAYLGLRILDHSHLSVHTLKSITRFIEECWDGKCQSCTNTIHAVYQDKYFSKLLIRRK